MQGTGWQVHCPEEYLLLTLARACTKKKKNRLMDRWKNTGLQMAYFIKEMAKRLSNPITPPARSHAGLFRLVTDAITIHTCSSHLRLRLTGETPALYPSFTAGHGRTKQDVWLWNSWRPLRKTKMKEQNLTERKCQDSFRFYISAAGSWRAGNVCFFYFLVVSKKLRPSSGFLSVPTVPGVSSEKKKGHLMAPQWTSIRRSEER